MKVIKNNPAQAQSRASELFKGKVSGQPILESSENSNLRVSVVNFDKGAVNVFHTHTVDQVLFVISGTGIVATEQEEARVSPGDFIVIPAGEKHWHGSDGNSAFSHIAISTSGQTKW
ncbi:MAG: cupin domain-containing protein [Pseudomonadota bacterium]